mgnify:CR=1 FL=1
MAVPSQELLRQNQRIEWHSNALRQDRQQLRCQLEPRRGTRCIKMIVKDPNPPK